jgi:ribosome-associated protein
VRILQEDSNLSLQPEAALAADDRATTGERAASGAQNGRKSEVTSEALLAAILSSISDDKAEDIVEIDLRGKTAIGDYMVICSGRSTRQVTAIAEKLAERLKAEFGVSPRSEGKNTGDWVLIDTGDVIVHVFRPEVREFYQLEKMWLPGSVDAT